MLLWNSIYREFFGAVSLTEWFVPHREIAYNGCTPSGRYFHLIDSLSAQGLKIGVRPS